MVNTYVMVVFKKCDPTKRVGKLPCHVEAGINDFIKDMQIDSWAVQENIKMDTLPGRKPTFETQETFSSYMLSDSII